MQNFTSRPHKMPQKLEPKKRRQSFREIYDKFKDGAAKEQSARCAQCGVPFCQVHCPVQNNIPDWLLLTAENRLEEAYAVSQATNNFPEICGRICPQDRLCEGACVIEQSTHGTVTIGAVERYITDTAWEKGWVKPVQPLDEKMQTVGIIGAGPAGLSAAEELRRAGYQVTVYDRYDRIGGLMIYGIPNFKLEKEVVERRAKLIEDSGVVFKLNCEVGKDISFSTLRARHDAVLIATGVYKARLIKAPGVGLRNIQQALDYLVTSNRIGLGDKVEDFDNGLLDAKGKKVVVIGGGDTAMDCVRTAVRQGAKEVRCLYRRDRANMPGSRREVTHAEEEGVAFEWLAAPTAFVEKSDGKTRHTVGEVRVAPVHLGAPDASGRQKPFLIEGEAYALEADMVIKALGFDAENLPDIFAAQDLALTNWGTVKTSYPSMMTSLSGVFAAGDIVRGASLVVWAIREGRDAAAGIAQYLQHQSKVDSGSMATKTKALAS